MKKYKIELSFDAKKAKREVEKLNSELLELHQRCVKDYLITHKNANLRTRNKFFKLYAIFIKEDNIREYFFRPISLFVQSLVRGELDSIRDIINHQPKKHGKRKK